MESASPPETSGMSHSDNVGLGRAQSDAARHRLLRGLPWSAETSAAADRAGPGLATVLTVSSSCQHRPPVARAERAAWQSHLGCGQ